MTDAPPGSANFFESENGNIDTGKASFEDDGGSGAVPAIDTLKATFEDEEDARPSPKGPKTEGSDPRRDLYVLLDEPDSSHLAQAISLVVMLMIFASSVAFVLESTETVQSDPVLKKKMHVRSYMSLVGVPAYISWRQVVLAHVVPACSTADPLRFLPPADLGGRVHHRVLGRVFTETALLHRAAGQGRDESRFVQLVLAADVHGRLSCHRAVLDRALLRR